MLANKSDWCKFDSSFIHFFMQSVESIFMFNGINELVNIYNFAVIEIDFVFFSFFKEKAKTHQSWTTLCVFSVILVWTVHINQWFVWRAKVKSELTKKLQNFSTSKYLMTLGIFPHQIGKFSINVYTRWNTLSLLLDVFLFYVWVSITLYYIPQCIRFHIPLHRQIKIIPLNHVKKRQEKTTIYIGMANDERKKKRNCHFCTNYKKNWNW